MKDFFYFLKQSIREGHKVKYQTNDYWFTHKFFKPQEIYKYARKQYNLFKEDINVKESTYLTFIGTERTGHSLIGALLDAHKNIVVSHEINVLKLFSLKFPLKYIYALIIQNSKRSADLGRGESSYPYVVKDGYQGFAKEIKVIGDKDAKRDTAQIVKFEYLLSNVQKKVHKLKVLHVIRNPYDNVATICRRRGYIDDSVIKRYFVETEVCDRLIKSNEFDILQVHHNDFVANPAGELNKILEFLELEDVDGFIEKASSIVRKSTNKSRYSLDWTDEQKAVVAKECAKYGFLEEYQF